MHGLKDVGNYLAHSKYTIDCVPLIHETKCQYFNLCYFYLEPAAFIRLLSPSTAWICST